MTIHNDQASEQPSRLTLVQIGYLFGQTSPTKPLLMSQRIGVLDRAVNEPTLHHGRNLQVEVAHFAEAVHEGGIPVEVLIKRVGRIRQGELKGVGVVVVFEGFEVELAASKEQAMVLRSGRIGGYHVYDALVDEHVGVDLEPDL
ncbi:MAG: hypothetical protein ALECFALPRED_006451 [Alectoria fallacina]|uniref:Uncharacterized protein n=1 Tax=Alectoria fallacina TaxID=1903189 RepID=A0A8H3EWS9_9LECA|nr:MAG: hypothetical protein ALECFALPRED_006451 [Alectoria fallacina]